MKSKLYRVLVLLVAIAMMIPSFALAEETTPKVEWTAFTGEDFSVKLTKDIVDTPYDGKDGSTPFTYTVTDTTGEGYQVEWKSDKPAVASVTVVKTSTASFN